MPSDQIQEAGLDSPGRKHRRYPMNQKPKKMGRARRICEHLRRWRRQLARAGQQI